MNEYRINYIEWVPAPSNSYYSFSNCSNDLCESIYNALEQFYCDYGFKEDRIKSVLIENKSGKNNVTIEYKNELKMPMTCFINITEDTFDDAIAVFRKQFPYEEILKVELVEDEI